MELGADTVTDELTHDTKPMLTGMGLDRLPDLVDRTARMDCRDAEIERPGGLLHQPERWFVDVADKEGSGGVAVHAVHVKGHVDIDDVAVGEGP